MTASDVVVVFGSGTLANDMVAAASAAGYRAFHLENLGALERETVQAHIAIEACAADQAAGSDQSGKRKALKCLAHVLRPDAVLLADALPATAQECATWSGRPRHCVGYGVLGRLQEQSVVEFVRTPETLDAAFERARAFVASLGIETRTVGDHPGLISGRTIAALANEAAWAVGGGVASEDDVDRAMQLGTNYPRGPLAWAREVGVGRVLAILENLRRHDGDTYAPAPLLLEWAMQSAARSEAAVNT